MSEITLYNDDCFNIMNQMINDEIKVDCIITDIPDFSSLLKYAAYLKILSITKSNTLTIIIFFNILFFLNFNLVFFFFSFIYVLFSLSQVNTCYILSIYLYHKLIFLSTI